MLLLLLSYAAGILTGAFLILLLLDIAERRKRRIHLVPGEAFPK